MAYTQADLNAAAAKLNACELNAAETEAVADYLAANLVDDEVSGFNMERPGKGFILEVAGIMQQSFTATDDLAAAQNGDGYILHRKMRT